MPPYILNAGAGFSTYTWNGNPTNQPTYQANTVGSFNVTVTNSHGGWNGIININITDVVGHLISSAKVNSNGKLVHTISLNNVNNGLYFLKATGADNKQLIFKLQVQK